MTLETRVSVLENDQRILDNELRDLKEQMKGMATVQNNQHSENGLRLTAIENTLLEIKVYFKVGRYVMNTLYAVGGAIATAFFIKWLGLSKP